TLVPRRWAQSCLPARWRFFKSIMSDKLNHIVATFFYSGKVPHAPGTAGSILALLVFYLIRSFVDSYFILAGITFIVFLVGVYVSGKEQEKSGIEDPSFVVIDEVAGIFLALLFVSNVSVINYLIVLALFRFFDITKILFIKRVEGLKGGWGIMCDDILAGLYAGICFIIISKLFLNKYCI
ncbi:MAG: phosphatidylglycerophosphatase A, partial [Candidatus Aureabacteria bacterium]|nr:phosphatidylglycerophosphatase A [Candidatus Auribacterota bacterium]